MEHPATEPTKKSAHAVMDLPKLLLWEMRPKQWPKNLIVFAPLLFAGRFNNGNDVVLATGCFVSFCLISSGIYVLNDVLDVEADRAHPKKKNRPIASGLLDIRTAAVAGFLSCLIGLLCAFAVRPSLIIGCLGYICINVMYSLRLKHIVLVDLFCVASGFVIRAVSGALAIHVAPSSWFLVCTSLGALFLATEKRRKELSANQGVTTHRRVLSEYSDRLLMRIENIVVPGLLTAYTMYSFQSPHGQWMMITVPFVLYGIMRYQLLSESGTATGAPEDVFWKDRPIQLTLLLYIAACAFVIYASPSYWCEYYGRLIDSWRLAH